jgi:hypothetical protein
MKNGSILREGSPVLAPSSWRSSPAKARGLTSTAPARPFIERSRGDYLRCAGGTGWGVRLIARLGESFA